MKKWFVLALIIIGFILPADLLHSGFPYTDDAQDHIARIANFYLSLTQGNIVPRWAENLNWGYGHPVLEFLYPLPSYLAAAFHVIGFSLINSYKSVLASGIILSGLTMFLWLVTFLDPAASFIGAFVYLFAPYRMIDVYVRGDIGENLAFVFIPLVLWSLKKLSVKFNMRIFLVGSLSVAGVILAHNAIALMVMPFFIVYVLVLFLKKRSLPYLGQTICLVGFGFLMSAFFWIPGLWEGKYTLRNIVTAGGYATRFVSFSRLLYGQWRYGIETQFTMQLGIVEWVGICLSPILLVVSFLKKKISTEVNMLVSMCFLFSVVSIFLISPQSMVIWSHVMLLQNFQFPWRFLGLLVLSNAVLVACIVHVIKKWQVVVVGLVVVITFALQFSYFHAQSYIQKPESFFTGIYAGTTDTGESSPLWSVRFMEHTAAAPMQGVTGNARITQVSRTSTSHLYHVMAMSTSELLENTVYFPGWVVLVDNKPVTIQYQNPAYRGLMLFTVPSGEHTVRVLYTDTKLRSLSDFLSIVGFGIFVILMGYQEILKRKK